jgi:hypothetical protein
MLPSPQQSFSLSAMILSLPLFRLRHADLRRHAATVIAYALRFSRSSLVRLMFVTSPDFMFSQRYASHYFRSRCFDYADFLPRFICRASRRESC